MCFVLNGLLGRGHHHMAQRRMGLVLVLALALAFQLASSCMLLYCTLHTTLHNSRLVMVTDAEEAGWVVVHVYLIHSISDRLKIYTMRLVLTEKGHVLAPWDVHLLLSGADRKARKLDLSAPGGTGSLDAARIILLVIEI